MVDVEDFNRLTQNLSKDIKNILNEHSAVSHSNALVLNQVLQEHLKQIRHRLAELLKTVQNRYQHNEELLLSRMRDGVSVRGAHLRGRTFYFKGNMYFRDSRGRNCDNTADYEYRSTMEKEMFPADFNLRARHVWSIRDKSGIVKGIKQQAIDHMGVLKSKCNKTSKQIAVHTETLVELLSRVDNNFEVDWHTISSYNLCHRHSPYSCEAMWHVYLHPNLNRNAWSETEDDLLLAAAKRHKFQNWPRIAAEVGQRSDYQCMVRFQTALKNQLEDRWTKWKKSDDERLLKVIESYSLNGVINWNSVNANFPGKPKSSLISRYYYTLNPKISHERFTPEEDLLLLAAVEEYKGKFYLFPRTLFPNRTLCQLRSRYYTTLTQRSKIEAWSMLDDKKLMEFVAEHGTSAWAKCAEKMGNHTRISCRTRFYTIKRYFDKNPDAKLEDLPRRDIRASTNGITQENWVNKINEISNMSVSDLEASQILEEVDTFKDNLHKRNKADPAANIKLSSKKSKQPASTKSLYKNRLRPMNLRLYNFFKFGYNQRVDADVLTRAPRTDDTLRLVAGALDYKVEGSSYTTHGTLLDNILPNNVRSQYVELMRNMTSVTAVPENYSLPPSWSTAMGFRAMCILSSQVPKSANDEALEYDADHPAVQQFRKRLRTLFYKTALLSRLNPEMFNGLEASLNAASKTIPVEEQTSEDLNSEVVSKNSAVATISKAPFEEMAGELVDTQQHTNERTVRRTSDEDHSNQIVKRQKLELPLASGYKIEDF